MGSLNLPLPQLSLDLNQTQSSKSVHAFLQEISMIRDVSEKKSKLSMYVQGLEDEMKKIDGLKEVLPLSMLVLNDAIETLKEEVTQCRNIEPEPIIEEFIPLKRTLDDDQDDERTRIEKESRDKKNWLSSVQLGISNGSSDSTTNFDENHNSIERVEEDRRSTTTNPFQNCNKYMNGEGAFVPFKGISGSGVMNKKREEKDVKSFSSLPFLMPGLKTTTMEPCLIPKTTSSSINKMLLDTRMPSPPPAPQPPQQCQRKQRRCWSPELHRRFVNALQQLGGSQAATPKQIRELMKVDGLTNDEVKSHLQKYRLHTRRNSNGSTGGNQPVVVLGGLWVPQDNQYESSKSHSGSPQGPLQLASAMAGNSMDEEEDEKSETYSWKGHSQKSSEDEA